MRAVLSKLIDRELMLAEVDRYAPPEPTAAAIDREVARVRARFASDGAFEAALARSGIDVPHLRETLRDELRIQAYLDQRFTVPPPTEDEIGKYYREHAAEFTRGGAPMAFEAARPEIVEALAARAPSVARRRLDRGAAAPRRDHRPLSHGALRPAGGSYPAWRTSSIDTIAGGSTAATVNAAISAVRAARGIENRRS